MALAAVVAYCNVAGVGRTCLAMARDHELPTWLAAVHPRHRVPHRAELVLGAVVLVLVSTVDPRGAIGFSSFAVLPLTVLGAAGCLLLAATLPPPAVAGGFAVLLTGLLNAPSEDTSACAGPGTWRRPRARGPRDPEQRAGSSVVHTGAGTTLHLSSNRMICVDQGLRGPVRIRV